MNRGQTARKTNVRRADAEIAGRSAISGPRLLFSRDQRQSGGFHGATNRRKSRCDERGGRLADIRLAG